MVERSTRQVSKWVAAPGIRGTILVPPDVRGAAHIVAIIRALLLDARLSAGDEYQEMAAMLTPEVQAIKAEAEALVSNSEWLDRATENGKRWLGLRPSGARNLGPQMLGAQDILSKRGSKGQTAAFEATDAKVTTFSQRWLFGRETGRLVLWALATLDASGVDPLAIDWSRAERSPTWGEAYGEHKTRPSRRQHKDLMDRLKRQGRHYLTDDRMMETAADWVECYHVYNGPADWLRSQAATCETEDHTSRRFKPFREALGIAQGPGRPKLFF